MKEEDSFWKSAHISPGGGAWVSFWNDCWWPGMILKDAYPRVAAASMFQEAWVSNIVSFESEGVGWDLQLSISLRGGAERERLSLLHYLSLLPLDLITTGPAKLIWNSCSNGGFSVKSMYDTLNNARFHGIIDFPCKVIWQPFVPMKVNAFLWLLRHGRVLTHENLKRRGWSLASMCLLCKAAEENINHLFWSCPFSCSIWNVLQQMVEITGPLHADVAAIIDGWNIHTQVDWKRRFVRGIFHAFTWEIWRERNSRTFHDKSRHWRVIFHKICRTILTWVLASGVLNDDQQVEWLSQMNHLCPLVALRDARSSGFPGFQEEG
ncbi:unnamed protein product [Linum trigynum]|uniref:Reverse transcriptase zinc-binding domain-containing protein n=1 Tax=Linum trigynum TaxID=586398 RepID=A0AAV2ELV4_9ROSI